MEQKLKEFKSRRRREVQLNSIKIFFRGIREKISAYVPVLTSNINATVKEGNDISNKSEIEHEERSFLLASDTSICLHPPTWSTIALYVLYILLWGIFYMIAIQIEFGFVYIVLSGLFFIYFNTRTGPKMAGEISAYSVFNPKCESIDGTLKAEQLEREFNLIQH